MSLDNSKYHDNSSDKLGYFAVIVIIILIIIVFIWWYYGVYSAKYPAPNKPESDVRRLIGEYESYPKWLWFQNNPCKFDEWLTCRQYRIVVFESNGEVIYDNAKYVNFPYTEPTRQLVNSVEYARASTLTQGVVIRDLGLSKTVNLAELAKYGDRYRIVHISEYVYSYSGPEL